MLSIRLKEGQMTIKLTDTQFVILSAAAQRDDHAVLPLPKSLKIKKAGASKVLKSLMAKGLIAERPAGLDDEVWREDKDGTRLTLAATDKGLEAIGVVPESEQPKKARTDRKKAGSASVTGKNGKASSPPKSQGTPAISRSPSKQATIIGLLKRKDGATIDDLTAATGWQAHSVRGAISGALKKKLGLAVSSQTVDGRGRVYRIAEGT
jgi:DNA-binding MarR family transcriptional regulator